MNADAGLQGGNPDWDPLFAETRSLWGGPPEPLIEITVFAKRGGGLSKRISLDANGALISDGSACVMARGRAKRLPLSSLEDFAELIARLDPHEAIALGALRSGLPDEVEITTKRHINGNGTANVVARTSEYIVYRQGTPALALLDFDRKGMPPDVAERVRLLGGPKAAILSVMPELANAGSVIRTSTSSGLSRSDTGERFKESGGAHWFILVLDGSDVERYLKTFHDRCWLHGLGWLMVGAGGQLLERSLVDRNVYSPERLVFEAAPSIIRPLQQDRSARTPRVIPGEPLDTRQTCPDLTLADRDALQKAIRAARQQMAPQAAEARAAFVERHAGTLSQRLNVPLPEARRMIEAQCEGVLVRGIALLFDDKDLGAGTVADVLDDPERFIGATLADPLEGPEYGRGKAKILRRPDGTLFINSFAHGRTVYELRDDAVADPPEPQGPANPDDGWPGPDPQEMRRDQQARETREDIADEPGPPINPWDALKVPSFPIYILPEVLRKFVQNRAEITGAGTAGLAWSGISACSCALHGRTRLRMKRHDSWSVPASIWVALIGRVSAMKSPIIDAGWAPLEAEQGAELRRWQEAHKRWKSLPKKEREDTPEPTPSRRLFTKNATTEAVQDILSLQDRGLGVMRDELAGFVCGMEEYKGGKGSDRSFWLESYNGNPFVGDRISRGTFSTDNLLATVIGGIQPDRLLQFTGLTDDGLFQRFVPILVPPAEDGSDLYDPAPCLNYSQAVQGLLRVPSGVVVTLSDKAHTIREDVAQRLRQEIRNEALGAPFAGFCGKLIGLWGRLCLTLHFLEPNPGSEVSGETADIARELIFHSVLPNAARVYLAMGGGGADMKTTQAIAGYILAKGKQRVLASELARDVRACRGKGAFAIRQLVDPLVVGGWLVPLDEQDPTAWSVLPIVHPYFKERGDTERANRARIRELIQGDVGAAS